MESSLPGFSKQVREIKFGFEIELLIFGNILVGLVFNG